MCSLIIKKKQISQLSILAERLRQPFVTDSVKELKTKTKKNQTTKPSTRFVGSNPTDASIFNYLCFLEEFIIQLRHLEI
jgi:hypothetical protein